MAGRPCVLLQMKTTEDLEGLEFCKSQSSDLRYFFPPPPPPHALLKLFNSSSDYIKVILIQVNTENNSNIKSTLIMLKQASMVRSMGKQTILDIVSVSQRGLIFLCNTSGGNFYRDHMPTSKTPDCTAVQC